jgi:hypothetical protein
MQNCWQKKVGRNLLNTESKTRFFWHWHDNFFRMSLLQCFQWIINKNQWCPYCIFVRKFCLHFLQNLKSDQWPGITTLLKSLYPTVQPLLPDEVSYFMYEGGILYPAIVLKYLCNAKHCLRLNLLTILIVWAYYIQYTRLQIAWKYFEK